MKTSLFISAFTGIIWAALAVVIMGGELALTEFIPFAVAGIIAGIFACLHTIKTRQKEDGDERFWSVIFCYYGAIVVFWAAWVLLQRFVICFNHRSWSDLDLRDNLLLAPIMLLYGTFPWGLALIPLCWLNRRLVWRIYECREMA